MDQEYSEVFGLEAEEEKPAEQTEPAEVPEPEKAPEETAEKKPGTNSGGRSARNGAAST